MPPLKIMRRWKKGGNTVQINDTQLQMVNDQVKRLIHSDNFYGRKL